MALTLDQAHTLIEDRFTQYPQFGAIGRSLSFERKISDILDFEQVDHMYLLPIAHEVRIVLALYAPLSELALNIEEATGLATETCTSLATMISSTVLAPVYDDLAWYQALWMNEESDDTTPRTPPESIPTPARDPAQPLTRDELMKALEQKRSAPKGDIESMRQKLAEAAASKKIGYDVPAQGE